MNPGLRMSSTSRAATRDAMEILGHSRISVTLEIYTAVDEDSRRQALGKMGDLLGGEDS